MGSHTLSLRRNAARRLLAIASCACAASAGAQQYSFSFLPPSDDVFVNGLSDTGNGINNAGHVAGTVGATHDRWGQLWSSPTTALSLPTSLCCTFTETRAHDINNADWVVGLDTYRAALWVNRQPTMLAALADEQTSVAVGINDAGQAVGHTNTTSGATRATLWTDGQAVDLGTLGGTSSYAHDINNSGMVAGSSQLAGTDALQATLWLNGTATDLGAVGEALAVNDAGQVVGHGSGRATLWEQGTLTYLSSFGSHANDINNRGQAVGSTIIDWEEAAESHATLWTGGTAIDLNSFLSLSDLEAGWHLEDALAINDHGWITGTAFNPLLFQRSAYLLTVSAVPEASTLTLWLAGLGLLWIASRRARGRGHAQPPLYLAMSRMPTA